MKLFRKAFVIATIVLLTPLLASVAIAIFCLGVTSLREAGQMFLDLWR